MIKRNASSSVQQHQDTLRQQIHQNSTVDFFNVLTGPLLLELLKRICQCIENGCIRLR